VGVVLLRDSGAERGSGTGLLVESWLEVEESGWFGEVEGFPDLFLAGGGGRALRDGAVGGCQAGLPQLVGTDSA
jgi:hypothetical protein